jgi:Icc-related predicted phosphoesterase
MTLIRLQGSDFQLSKNHKGNLDKLATIAEHSKMLSTGNEKVAGVDLVGDLYDTHFILSLKGQFMEQHPEVVEMLQKGEGEKLQSVPGFKELAEAVTREPQMMQQVYQAAEKIVAGIDTDVYGVTGNNDAKFIKDIVKSVKFSDLEQKMIESGPFRIIGANNTNYPEEQAVASATERPDLAFQPDDGADLSSSSAYQNLNVRKTGKKANILQLHGPPNGVGMRNNHDSKTVGITKLIEEHKPGLVECGHFHSARISTKNNTTYARSSPNYYFEHHFDDSGKYEKTEIFSYASAA